MILTDARRVLIFKGRPSIVNFPPHKAASDELYAALRYVLEAEGYSVSLIESPEEPVINDHAATDVAFLIGHSRGASKIIRELDATKFPALRGIVCLDPNQDTLGRWKTIGVPKLLVGSTIGNKHSYTEFSDTTLIEDDHYLNKSLLKVRNIVIGFMRNADQTAHVR